MSELLNLIPKPTPLSTALLVMILLGGLSFVSRAVVFFIDIALVSDIVGRLLWLRLTIELVLDIR